MCMECVFCCSMIAVFVCVILCSGKLIIESAEKIKARMLPPAALPIPSSVMFHRKYVPLACILRLSSHSGAVYTCVTGFFLGFVFNRPTRSGNTYMCVVVVCCQHFCECASLHRGSLPVCLRVPVVHLSQRTAGTCCV